MVDYRKDHTFYVHTRFRKGEEGNKKGRPRGKKTLTTTLRNLLEEEMMFPNHPITGKKDVKLSLKDMLIISMLKEAFHGNMVAIKEVMERVDGKVVTPVDHTGVNIQLAAMLEYIQDPNKFIDNVNRAEENKDEPVQ